VGIWSRVLTSAQIGEIYAAKAEFKNPIIKRMPDSLTFLTWNIWLGGRKEGRFVGVQRVADVIRKSGADVIALQEMYGSGELIADQLGFYYYQRSSGIGILSRFPIGKTYNVYRAQNIGAVNIELPENQQVVFCSVWLNYLPNTRAYVSSGLADPDTIIAREMETRGNEMRYVLWELQTLLNQRDNLPIVTAGDFNSGSHLDWTRANKDNNFGLAVEFPVSKFIQDAGFIDSYRKVYPNEITNRGLTWPINTNDGFQDRTDFIYYTGSKLEIVSTGVIDTFSYGFPSDHAAVITSFKFKE
jgi:endonuclease/exonuclease/phosphatase family metal-dependent hydrolase